jgi:hypothetical protein
MGAMQTLLRTLKGAMQTSLFHNQHFTSKLAALLTQAVCTPNQSGVKVSEFFSGKSRLATLFLGYKGKTQIYNGGKHENFDFSFLTRKIGQNWSRVYQKMRNSNIWGGGRFFRKSSICLYFHEKIMILEFSDYNGVIRTQIRG